MRRFIAAVLCVFLTLWLTLPAFGQTTVTDDDVNRLASRLYCPVCPNETLDACRTDACAQWRNDIRVQLESGATDQQVIDTFVARFGERVIGNPQDPALRALAIGAPLLIGIAALVVGAITFLRWRNRPITTTDEPANPVDLPDSYRKMIERDLE